MNLSKTLSVAVFAATLLLAVCANAVDKETVLYNFNSNTSGGSGPAGGLLMDQSGNLYGDTLTGEIFELSPNGSGGWNFSELVACGSCAYPVGPLVMDHAGNLYGADFFGNVFEISPNGSGGWTEDTAIQVTTTEELQTTVSTDISTEIKRTVTGAALNRAYGIKQ